MSKPKYQKIKHYQTMAGWWFRPLWRISVSLDDYSQYMEKKKVPNHQPNDQTMFIKLQALTIIEQPPPSSPPSPHDLVGLSENRVPLHPMVNDHYPY